MKSALLSLAVVTVGIWTTDAVAQTRSLAVQPRGTRLPASNSGIKPGSLPSQGGNPSGFGTQFPVYQRFDVRDRGEMPFPAKPTAPQGGSQNTYGNQGLGGCGGGYPTQGGSLGQGGSGAGHGSGGGYSGGPFGGVNHFVLKWVLGQAPPKSSANLGMMNRLAQKQQDEQNGRTAEAPAQSKGLLCEYLNVFCPDTKVGPLPQYGAPGPDAGSSDASNGGSATGIVFSQPIDSTTSSVNLVKDSPDAGSMQGKIKAGGH
jgi:hypothetical protein